MNVTTRNAAVLRSTAQTSRSKEISLNKIETTSLFYAKPLNLKGNFNGDLKQKLSKLIIRCLMEYLKLTSSYVFSFLYVCLFIITMELVTLFG